MKIKIIKLNNLMYSTTRTIFYSFFNSCEKMKKSDRNQYGTIEQLDEK